MQHDTNTPTAGVDWATDTNELCIVDGAGRVVARHNLVHDAAGIRQLVDALVAHDVARVAIERPDGPAVDAVLAAGVDVVVITPRQVKQLRARYTATGSKDDRFDAYVLADVARTDGHRLTALTPDSRQTVALRSVVRARSLPRAGRVRAAKLLAEIGDARGCPTDDALAALAGAAPTTKQSGRHHVVVFRWACDLKLRAVTDFAADSRRASPWAAAIYDRHRDAGTTHQHATRILARAWLRVIWRCWQDGVAYDPTNHGGNKPFLTPTDQVDQAA